MPHRPWPPSFDALLRTHLSLGDGEEIAPELTPFDYGLDSLSTVGLLLDLEEQYAITLADDQLAQLGSADTAGLWALLAKAGAEWDEGQEAAG